MSILIVDNGEYTWLAERLRQEDEVAYYSVWENAYPLARTVAPGAGLVERVNNPIEYLLDSAPDLVVVPDLNHNDFEVLSRQSGVPTFGSGNGNRLEQDRLLLKHFLDDHGLPSAPYEEIDGIDDLEEYLREPRHKNRYIKVSTFRGDMDTFHHVDWDQTSNWLMKLRVQLGPLGAHVKFLVEEHLETELELSIEGVIFGGKMMEPFLVGMEIKYAGEAGFYCDSLAKLPGNIRECVEALEYYFKPLDYRNFFAVEIRLLDDGTPYITDVACRMPVPPGAAMAYSMGNIMDVMTSGEAPDFGGAGYFVEIELESPWVIENFLRVDYPDDIADHVALFNHCVIDDQRWCLPHTPTNPNMSGVGSVFAYGDDLESLTEECIEYAESIQAIGIHFRKDVLAEAQEKLDKASELGIAP